MRLAARERLSIELPESQARELAVFGSLSAALARLKDRLSVQRAIPGAVADSAAQVRLAAFELAAEATGGSTARREIIVQAMDAERAVVSKQSSAAEKLRAIEDLLGEARISAPSQREFIRRADRLRTRQINRLRMMIYDPAILAGIVDSLDKIYSRHLGAALKS
jgi:hypothetical protein